jgi:aspartate/methionine/tyrosine aminotransferase
MITKEAEQLNEKIEKENLKIFRLLSARGRSAFFPKSGILSQAKEAAGKKINATIGIALSDGGEAMHLEEISKNVSLPSKQIYDYAPGYGVKDLRDKWQEMMLEKNPSLKKDSLSPALATSGLTHGLFVAGYLFADEGDEIIIPDLYWENYDLVFGNNFGAKLSVFPMFKGGSFNIDGLKEKLSKKGPDGNPEASNGVNKKIVLLNFPNNPTGYSPTKKEAEEMVEVISEASKKEAIVVICDDAYFGLNFEDNVFEESVFGPLSSAGKKILAVKIDGSSKEDFAWGLRVGFLTFGSLGLSPDALAALADKAAGAIRGSVSNVSNLSQNLLLKAINSPNYKAEKKAHFDELKERFDEVKSVLAKNHNYLKYFRPLPFNSGYFMCVEILPPNDAEAIRKKTLERGVGAISFKNVLRLAFSSVPKGSIKEMFEAIYNVCKN